MRHIKQFIRFAMVGVVATLTHILFLYLFTEFAGLYYILSSVLAFLFAVTISFILNKKYTFKDNSRIFFLRKYSKFFAVSVTALIVNLNFLFIFTEIFGIYYILSQLFATFFSLGINFMGNKLWTFNIK